MKIAMIAGFYPPDIRGGGEISGKLLADILVEAGADVSVLTCSAEARHEVLDGVRVKRVISPNVYWNFYPDQPKLKKLEWYARENMNPRAHKTIRAFIDDVNPDIVLTSTIENFGAEAWLAPRRAKIPSVHVLRSYYPFCWQGSAVKKTDNCAGKCLDCKVLTFGRRRASQYVNGIVGISKYILQRHLDEGTFLTARQTIIPEPITADLIASQARQTSQARFGYLGILRDDKGLGTLLEAWNIAANSTATLCIAGKGSSEYEAELKAELPNNAKFLGWVDSSTYLANIDFLIVPSVWHEPFGRIVIEAFAKGIPVIGSRIGGIADTIRDGENGFLFTPRSAPELAQCIERCALLDAAAYGRLSSRAHADSQAYEAKRIAREHLSFYESVIADSRQAENRSVKNTVTFDQKALL